MANKVSDLFNQLKSFIVGTKTSEVDKDLDNAMKDIISYKSHSGRNGYIDLVRTVIAKSSIGSIFSPQAGGLFGGSQSTPAVFGQGKRLLRYRTYSSIVSNIDYAVRALNVLTDNILSPDDITKVSLEITSGRYLGNENELESNIRYLKDIISSIQLEKHLHLIVRNTLEFGDFFCEVTSSKEALLSRSILTENFAYEDYLSKKKKHGLYHTWKEEIKRSTNGKKELIDVHLDLGELLESKQKVKDVKLIFHKPELVVKLQSFLFPICFGYLVFPDIPGITTSEPVGQHDAVNQVCIDILTRIQKHVPQIKEFADDEELKSVIYQLLLRSKDGSVLNIRYVPPDRMEHFYVPSLKYYPYGQSIFDSSQFTAKVLIALETALAIQRLARSTEKRKIAIEVGLPRDAKKAIELMKEEFRKRKISLDSFGTVDTIPSMITTFEDIYIPQRDGKSFVDISTFSEGNVDVRSKVDELKFLRDQLTASWGIPPSFLGIEENLSNKAALTEENILFARTIISHQKYLSEQINNLLKKVVSLLDPEKALTIFDLLQVVLPAPKSLQFERESRYMNDVVGLIENLERIGIPKEYSKRKYLTQFDWDDIKKYEIEQKVEKTLDTSKKEEEGGFGPAPGGF